MYFRDLFYGSNIIITAQITGFLGQVIIGNILGDAWIEKKSPNANARLRYEQGSPKGDARFYYVYKFYALYCAGNSVTRIRTDPRFRNVIISNMFSTRSLPYFTYYYNLFYVNNVYRPQLVNTLLRLLLLFGS